MAEELSLIMDKQVDSRYDTVAENASTLDLLNQALSGSGCSNNICVPGKEQTLPNAHSV